MASTRGLRAFKNARQRKKAGPAPDPNAIFAHAIALHQAGQVGQAKILYREILKARPDHFDALHFLAVVEYQEKNLDEAERLFRRALSANPQSADAHSNFSLVFYQRGDYARAVALCDTALALKPAYAEAFCNRGNALCSLDRYEEALADADRALALKPGFVNALDVRGSALFKLKRYGEALDSYQKAIDLNPRFAQAYSNRAMLHAELKKLDQALADYERAFALNPSDIKIRLGYAHALLAKKRAAAAIAEVEKALAIEPNNYEAWVLLGQCHEGLSDMAKAVPCYDRALAIRPDCESAIHYKIFALDFIETAGFEEQLEARRYWWEHIGKPAAAALMPHDNDRDPGRRLVIGYVSADFRQHSAAFGFRPLLARHDRAKFEVVCYSCVANPDKETEEFKRVADRWRDVADWSDDRLAEQIQADKVDILIDMAGHSAGNRLKVFARKPAPVQVTYGTGNGLPTIDYLFSTEVSVPPHVRPLFAETVYDLPSVMTLEPFTDDPPADPPVLANGFVTYGIVNRINKMSDRAMDVWASILRADETARLIVKHVALSNEAVRDTLRARFASRGIAAERLDLRGGTPRLEHMKVYNEIDICLDTFPSNGGISTWEALHMGVPVVASLGNSVAARASGSILASIGLEDWVAGDDDGYAAIALKFAAMPEHLKALRQGFPERIANSTAGNNVTFARAIDAAYRDIWQRYCAKPA